MLFQFSVRSLRPIVPPPIAMPLIGNLGLIWLMSERGHGPDVVLETVVIVNVIVIGLTFLTQFGKYLTNPGSQG
jgi:hypothetical protein